jgi:two-component system response regulator GlrR
VVVATNGVITPDLLLLGGSEIADPHQKVLTLKEAREKFERTYLVQILTLAKGNVSRAAELTGQYRAEFYKLLRKHALDPGVFKAERTTE